MMPEPQKLENIKVKKDGVEVELDKLLVKMNERIEYLYDRDHTIGHAYFMKLKDIEEDKRFDELKNIFRNKIIPLLAEYFYDDWEKIRLILADNQVDEDFQFIKKQNNNIKNLFGSIEELEDEKAIYEINEGAFDEAESYIKIYENNEK